MIFTETKIKGAFIIEPELLEDERGFFARSFSQEEFQKYGLETDIVQCNISYNKKKGTLRGMHYQVLPFEEAKIVSCFKGSIYDVIVDLRRESATCRQWVAVELSDENFRMVYIPKGCAHGFQTLMDDVTVYYQMTEFFHPEYSHGVKWDDAAFGIRWPTGKKMISERDKQFPGYCL
ncbi:MAG: dTDP-4-dehydrorhamnose 3,5-epimerase [Methanoregula sp.]|jgi:dTDP-4-dehydrorhamnose 3,5-epimerase